MPEKHYWVCFGAWVSAFSIPAFRNFIRRSIHWN